MLQALELHGNRPHRHGATRRASLCHAQAVSAPEFRKKQKQEIHAPQNDVFVVFLLCWGEGAACGIKPWLWTCIGPTGMAGRAEQADLAMPLPGPLGPGNPRLPEIHIPKDVRGGIFGVMFGPRTPSSAKVMETWPMLP